MLNKIWQEKLRRAGNELPDTIERLMREMHTIRTQTEGLQEEYARQATLSGMEADARTNRDMRTFETIKNLESLIQRSTECREIELHESQIQKNLQAELAQQKTDFANGINLLHSLLTQVGAGVLKLEGEMLAAVGRNAEAQRGMTIELRNDLATKITDINTALSIELNRGVDKTDERMKELGAVLEKKLETITQQQLALAEEKENENRDQDLWMGFRMLQDVTGQLQTQLADVVTELNTNRPAIEGPGPQTAIPLPPPPNKELGITLVHPPTLKDKETPFSREPLTAEETISSEFDEVYQRTINYLNESTLDLDDAIQEFETTMIPAKINLSKNTEIANHIKECRMTALIDSSTAGQRLDFLFKKMFVYRYQKGTTPDDEQLANIQRRWNEWSTSVNVRDLNTISPIEIPTISGRNDPVSTRSRAGRFAREVGYSPITDNFKSVNEDLVKLRAYVAGKTNATPTFGGLIKIIKHDNENLMNFSYGLKNTQLPYKLLQRYPQYRDQN
jgi:hypothetical protein